VEGSRSGLKASPGRRFRLLAFRPFGCPLAVLAVKTVLSVAATDSISTLTGGVLHAMFVKKVKVILAAALMLVALGGAGVCAYYLRAQEPVATRGTPAQPPHKEAAIKPAGKNTDTLQALLRERLKLAQDILKLRKSYPQAIWHNVIEASQLVLQADLELCPNKAARIAAHQRHVNVAEDLARFADQAVQGGGMNQADRQLSHYSLIDAKIGLEREKARE
jgi:hypothetical protein